MDNQSNSSSEKIKQNNIIYNNLQNNQYKHINNPFLTPFIYNPFVNHNYFNNTPNNFNQFLN